MSQQAVAMVHFAATWLLVGIVWFVQIVHYPLFRRVADFAPYQWRNIRLTALVAGPVMLVG